MCKVEMLCKGVGDGVFVCGCWFVDGDGKGYVCCFVVCFYEFML